MKEPRSLDLERLDSRLLLDGYGVSAEVASPIAGESSETKDQVRYTIETQIVTPTIAYEHLGENRFRVDYTHMPPDSHLWAIVEGHRTKRDNRGGWPLGEGSGSMEITMPHHSGNLEFTVARNMRQLGPWVGPIHMSGASASTEISSDPLEIPKLTHEAQIKKEIAEGSDAPEIETVVPSISYEHTRDNQFHVTYTDMPEDSHLWVVKAGRRDPGQNIWGWPLEKGDGELDITLPHYRGNLEFTIARNMIPLGPWKGPINISGYSVIQAPDTQPVALEKLSFTRVVEKPEPNPDQVQEDIPELNRDNVDDIFSSLGREEEESNPEGAVTGGQEKEERSEIVEVIEVTPTFRLEHVQNNKILVHFTDIPPETNFWVVRGGERRAGQNISGMRLPTGSGSTEFIIPEFRGPVEFTIASEDGAKPLGPWVGGVSMQGYSLKGSLPTDVNEIDQLKIEIERTSEVEEESEQVEAISVTPTIQYGVQGNFIVMRYTDMPADMALWIQKVSDQRLMSNMVGEDIAPGDGLLRMQIPFDDNRDVRLIIKDKAGDRFIGDSMPIRISGGSIVERPQDGVWELEEIAHDVPKESPEPESGLENLKSLDALPDITVTTSKNHVHLSYEGLPEGIEIEMIEKGREAEGSMKRVSLPSGSHTVDIHVPHMRGTLELVLCDSATGARFGERIELTIHEFDITDGPDETVLIPDPDNSEGVPPKVHVLAREYNPHLDAPESVVVIPDLYPHLKDGTRLLLGHFIVEQAGLVPEVSYRDIAAARNPGIFGSGDQTDSQKVDELGQKCLRDTGEQRAYGRCRTNTMEAQSDAMSRVANAHGIAEQIMIDAGLEAYDQILRERLGMDPKGGHDDWLWHYLFQQKDAHIAHDYIRLPREQGTRERVLAAFNDIYTYNIDLYRHQEVQEGNQRAREIRVVTNADLELEKAQELARTENNLRAISLATDHDPEKHNKEIEGYAHENPSEFLAWAGIERDYTIPISTQVAALLNADNTILARADLVDGRLVGDAGLSNQQLVGLGSSDSSLVAFNTSSVVDSINGLKILNTGDHSISSLSQALDSLGINTSNFTDLNEVKEQLKDQKFKVELQTHRVAGTKFFHLSLMITYEGSVSNSHLQEVSSTRSDGVQAISLGGSFNVYNNLIGLVNRTHDFKVHPDGQRFELQRPSHYESDADWVSDLIQDTLSIRNSDNIEYDALTNPPDDRKFYLPDNGLNSNSFLTSILDRTGTEYPSVTVFGHDVSQYPGLDTRIDDRHFKIP